MIMNSMRWLWDLTLSLSSLQLSGVKKEKDGEDKKRNPILKYIGKPRTTSQSSEFKHSHNHKNMNKRKH